jgi:magnesium transporter
MLDREFIVLLDTFRRMIRRNARSNTKKMVMKTHPADLAALFRSFTEGEREQVFSLISDQSYKAEFLIELDRAILMELIESLDPESIAALLKEMAPDDQVDIVAQLPEELGSGILSLMSSSDSEDIEELMMYPSDTAGGIMVPLPFKMMEDNTVADSISVIQERQNLEMIFYLYVVNENDKLSGVLSLRQLLAVSPSTKLKDIMTTRVISVFPETDQEEVARIASRYNFLALPVVDKDGVLLGIVTVDDIIDVIREEATEDFLQMAGVGKDREILLKSTFEAAKIRFPWLFATFIGGFIVSLIVMSFHGLISRFVILAAFMPIIAGMGGNVGAQSSTIVVRGIATGRVNLNQLFKVLFGQIKIGIILGVTYGLLLALFGNLVYHTELNIVQIGIVIGIALTLEMSIAATLGTLTPMLLFRFNVDPAVATGPLVSTTLDVTGVTIYYTIATLLLL